MPTSSVESDLSSGVWYLTLSKTGTVLCLDFSSCQRNLKASPLHEYIKKRSCEHRIFHATHCSESDTSMMPQTGEDFYAKDSWTLKRKRLHSSASHITQKRFEKPHTCAACDHYSPWGFLLKCQLPIQVKLCHRGSCRNWRGSAVHRASTHVWPMRWCCRTVWPVHSWIVTMYPGKRCSCHSYWS